MLGASFGDILGYVRRQPSPGRSKSRENSKRALRGSIRHLIAQKKIQYLANRKLAVMTDLTVARGANTPNSAGKEVS